MEENRARPGKPDEKENILRATGVVGGATLASRIFGYIRDMVTAYLFGAGWVTDAFFLAFRLPNTLRRLFGEGALSIAFIPVFTEHLTRGSRADAETLIRSSGVASFLILSVVTLLGVGFAPWIVKLFAYGFIYDPKIFNLAVKLTRVVFPYILLVGMVAWAMGVLNSQKHFFAPAFSPVFLNIGMICSALLCYPFFREPIFGLAVGVILGGILQVLLQIPFLLRTGFTFRGRISFSHPGLKRILILLAPAAIGLAVYQLNILVDMLLASFLPRGSISFLYYADRVIEVPMGIFATALATAVLPTMSEKTALNDMGGLKETLHHSLRTLLFIILPATLALAVLCTPITNVLFEHGKFGPEETLLTSRALLAFTVGLLGIGGVRIVVPVFYSLKDTWTPMRVALIAFLANLTLNLILMVPLKHAGLALSTSIAAYLNLSLLFYLLHRKIGAFHFSDVLSAGLKMLLAAGLMCALLMLAVHQIEWSAQTRLIIRILALAVMVGMGGIIYLLAAYLLKIEELNTFLNPVLRKLRSLRG